MFEKKTFTVDGLKITRNVDEEEINKFIEKIPGEKKSDNKNVLLALHEEELIDIEQVSQ